MLARRTITFFNSKLQESPCLQAFTGGFVLLLVLALRTIMTSWLLYNKILYPDYWYELLGPKFFVTVTVTVATYLAKCINTMKGDVVLVLKGMG